MNIEITCKTLKEISYVFEQCKKFCLINFNLIEISSSLTFNSVTKKILSRLWSIRCQQMSTSIKLPN